MLIVWVPNIRIQSGSLVRIFASVTDERGAPMPATAAVVVAKRGAQPGPTRPLQPAAAGADHQLELVFDAEAPDGRSATPPAYEYAVRAEGVFHGEPFARFAIGNFFVHQPGGKLEVDRARVEREQGDLALLLDAAIDRTGT